MIAVVHEADVAGRAHRDHLKLCEVQDPLLTPYFRVSGRRVPSDGREADLTGGRDIQR